MKIPHSNVQSDDQSVSGWLTQLFSFVSLSSVVSRYRFIFFFFVFSRVSIRIRSWLPFRCAKPAAPLPRRSP